MSFASQFIASKLQATTTSSSPTKSTPTAAAAPGAAGAVLNAVHQARAMVATLPLTSPAFVHDTDFMTGLMFFVLTYYFVLQHLPAVNAIALSSLMLASVVERSVADRAVSMVFESDPAVQVGVPGYWPNGAAQAA